jgi:hypothetical protein
MMSTAYLTDRDEKNLLTYLGLSSTDINDLDGGSVAHRIHRIKTVVTRRKLNKLKGEELRADWVGVAETR